MATERMGAAWSGSIESLRDYKNIPATTLHDLIRYCVEGRSGGDFIQAVICDKLMEAYRHADLGNIRGLWAIATWIYSRAPQQAFGGSVQMSMWRQVGGLRGWFQGPDKYRTQFLTEWVEQATKDTLLEGVKGLVP